MSYRISIKNQEGMYHQLLGNNEYYEPLIAYLVEQGCEVNEEQCFHDFEIKDLPKLIEIVVDYLKEVNQVHIENYDKSIFDLTLSEGSFYEDEFTIRRMISLHNDAYINTIPVLVNKFKDDLKPTDLTYEIKEGHQLFISGY